MSATVWLWKVEWATGFQHLPQHIVAGDIDNALAKAKALSVHSRRKKEQDQSLTNMAFRSKG